MSSEPDVRERAPDEADRLHLQSGHSGVEEVLGVWLASQMNDALADGDLSGAIRAMREASRIYGMSEVSRATGLNRVNLYRRLGECADPKLGTVLRILEIYNLRFTVERTSPRSVGETPFELSAVP